MSCFSNGGMRSNGEMDYDDDPYIAGAAPKTADGKERVRTRGVVSAAQLAKRDAPQRFSTQSASNTAVSASEQAALEYTYAQSAALLEARSTASREAAATQRAEAASVAASQTEPAKKTS